MDEDIVFMGQLLFIQNYMDQGIVYKFGVNINIQFVEFIYMVLYFVFKFEYFILIKWIYIYNYLIFRQIYVFYKF